MEGFLWITAAFVLFIVISLIRSMKKEKNKKIEYALKKDIIKQYISDDRAGKLTFVEKERYVEVYISYDSAFHKEHQFSISYKKITANPKYIKAGEYLGIIGFYYELEKEVFSQFTGLFVPDSSRVLSFGKIYYCNENDIDNILENLEEINEEQKKIDETETERLIIRNKLLEKERKKRLEKEVLDELIEEGEIMTKLKIRKRDQWDSEF